MISTARLSETREYHPSNTREMFISIGAGRTGVPSTLVDPFRYWHTSIMDHWTRWHFKQASYTKITSMKEKQTGAHNNYTSLLFHLSRKQKLLKVRKKYTSLHRFLLVQKEEIKGRDTCEGSFNYIMVDRHVHLHVQRMLQCKPTISPET